jgi:hypothetical protein
MTLGGGGELATDVDRVAVDDGALVPLSCGDAGADVQATSTAMLPANTPATLLMGTLSLDLRTLPLGSFHEPLRPPVQLGDPVPRVEVVDRFAGFEGSVLNR